MYLICAVLMFVRGGIDALLLRTQLTIPDNTSWNQITITKSSVRTALS